MTPSYCLTASHIAEELSDHDMYLFDKGMGPSQLRAEIDAGSCLLGRVEGELVSYALTRRQGPVVDITRLAVLPAFHGKGWGRDLLRATLRLHRSPQYMLNVRKDNKVAIHLYKSEGFTIQGVIGEAWLMVRTC